MNLVNDQDRSGRDLPIQLWVDTLPVELQIGKRTISRQIWLNWSNQLTLPPSSLDVAGWLFGLEAELRSANLPDEIEPRWPNIEAEVNELKARLAQRIRIERDWRATNDLIALSIGWLIQACDSLLKERPDPIDTVSEHFYLKTIHHGHLWVDEKQPFDASVRERAIRILLARSMPAEATKFTPFPLALVEATLRSYA